MKQRICILCMLSIILFLSLFPYTTSAQVWSLEEWKLEEWKLDESQIEEWELEDRKIEDWKLEEWKLEQWKLEQSERERGELPQDSSNGTSPSHNEYTEVERDNTGKQSNEKISNSSKNNSSKDSSDESFFDFKTPELSDLIDTSKDFLGGTVDLAYNGHTNGSLTGSDYTRYKLGLAGVGFKLFSTTDTTLGAGEEAFAGIGNAKQIYDTYSYYESYKVLKRFEEAGDLIGAANQYRNMGNLTAVKTLSPANSIISAVTMPLTIADTINNISDFKNETNSEKKTDTAWDIVGNVGDLMTGTAGIVAVIPGAQPVAVGLLAVGSALSLASVGRKLYKNRKEIASDLKKKYKIGKEKVSSFFKSIFK